MDVEEGNYEGRVGCVDLKEFVVSRAQKQSLHAYRSNFARRQGDIVVQRRNRYLVSPIGVRSDCRPHCRSAKNVIVVDETSMAVVALAMLKRCCELTAIDKQPITFCSPVSVILKVDTAGNVSSRVNNAVSPICWVVLSIDDAGRALAEAEGLRKLRKYRKNDDICFHH